MIAASIYTEKATDSTGNKEIEVSKSASATPLSSSRSFAEIRAIIEQSPYLYSRPSRHSLHSTRAHRHVDVILVTGDKGQSTTYLTEIKPWSNSTTNTEEEKLIDAWYARARQLAQAYDAEAVVIPFELRQALYDDELFEIMDID